MTAFLIITALILLNGIFVAAEFAIVGAPRASIDARAARGNRLAMAVQAVLRDTNRQDQYIATAQLGITVASLGLGMYGEHVLADWIYSTIAHAGAPAWLVSHGLASVVAIAILTYFHIVIGEMIPKSLALQQAETMALWITPPMLWIKTLVFPLVVSLNAIGNVLLRLFGVNRQAQNAEQVLHAGGAAARRAGERGAGRDSRGVGSDAAGAVRFRQPDRRRGHGAARTRHGPAARQHARPDQGSAGTHASHALSGDRARPRSHRRHDSHQGSAATAAAERPNRPAARATAAARARDGTHRHRPCDDAARAHADGGRARRARRDRRHRHARGSVRGSRRRYRCGTRIRCAALS